MIEAMKKVFVATPRTDEERLLDGLRVAEVVHLRPSQKSDAALGRTAIDDTLSTAHKADAILARHRADGGSPSAKLGPELIDEIIALDKRFQDAGAGASAAAAEIEQMGPWARFDDDFLEALAARGRKVQIFDVPKKARFEPEAELVFEVETGDPSMRRYAVISSADVEPSAPRSARVLPPPVRSATEVARALREQSTAAEKARTRLEELSSMKDALAGYIEDLEEQRELDIAHRSAVRHEEMAAWEGWIPASRVEHLRTVLSRKGVEFALEPNDPEPTDDPPTLVEYRRTTRPMSALFDILGALPGYRERDVSGPFLVALPIFAAMLIADGGYGLVFLLAGALGYKLVSRRMGAAAAQLLVVIGACSVLWGFVIASFFGVGPRELDAAGGGLWQNVGALLASLRLVRGDFTDQDVVSQVMRISFVIGAVHMSAAELWHARLFFPDLQALAHVGWAVFLWGMLLVVQTLVLEDPLHPATIPLLGAGAIAVVFFAHPHRNPLVRILYGLAGFPLAALGTLSDTISYIRLMAVGLASTILAATFNDLAAQAAQSATWIAGGLILLVGHGLNIGLAIIALFAHGVRLNMLEFSGHLGMSWNGYPYAPFAPRKQTQR